MGKLKQPPETSTYHFHNANPRGLRTSDCVIRAVCTGTHKTWQETLEALTELGIKSCMVPNEKDVYSKYLELRGWTKHPAPRKSDNKRYTGKDFGTLYKGECIANIGGHHTVYINAGVVWDIWDSTSGAIGNYWTPPEK